MTIRVAVARRNAGLDAAFDGADAGAGPATLKVYTGGQPTSAENSPGGTLLVTFTLADPAFTPAADGVKSLNVSAGITAAATASGTAGWARLADSNGLTIFDGNVATQNADFALNTTSVSSGQNITLTGGSITDPA